MNRYTATWGTLVAGSGIAMYFLLQALGQESFFMSSEYIPLASLVSLGVTAAGVLMIIASMFVEWPRYIGLGATGASKLFGVAALVNAVAAALFTVAMLLPPLEMPILFTEWPGIYIAIAYAAFVGFGVFGLFAWSMMYRVLPDLFSKSSLDRRSVVVQLVLSEVGVYGVSIFLFLAGFTGASLVHAGQVGPVVVGASMEFADIPAAASIFLVIVSVLLGSLNILRAKP